MEPQKQTEGHQSIVQKAQTLVITALAYAQRRFHPFRRGKEHKSQHKKGGQESQQHRRFPEKGPFKAHKNVQGKKGEGQYGRCDVKTNDKGLAEGPSSIRSLEPVIT